ncbi:MAG: hypothetical protein HY825_00465 [Acidobacteria bacterium]|nr:hypothetical protein [Acidobacteriota bacterium]
MKRLIGFTGAVGLIAAALTFAPAPGALAADPRNRGLEKAIAGRFDADGEGQVARAFRAAVQAGMAERQALSLVEVGVEGGFDAVELARVLTLAAQLELQHLPPASFAAKLEEGVAKRVAPERVLQAAERRALMLSRANSLLNAVVLAGLDVRDRDELLPDVAAALESDRESGEIRGILVDSISAGEGIGEIRRKLFP